MIACVGGGSNAIGMFADFIEETNVGLDRRGARRTRYRERRARRAAEAWPRWDLLRYEVADDADRRRPDRRVLPISAGLDFPSVGPQHAFLNSTGRADYVSITDDEALDAFKALSRHEGIIPALESSHALAHALKMMRENPEKEQLLVVNLSGRGDKDIFTVHDILKARGKSDGTL